MEIEFNHILISLSKGNFLETDGVTYWWVDEGSYKEIPSKTFHSFIKKKLVYSKRIDDETTCCYLASETKEQISPDFAREKAKDEYKISRVRSFINL